jgi:hypothetical protein
MTAVEESMLIQERAPVANSTSITTMTVAEVRRSLSYIRKSWDEQQTDPNKNPLYLSDPLSGSGALSIESFSLKFVLAHHARRLNKDGAGD